MAEINCISQQLKLRYKVVCIGGIGWYRGIIGRFFGGINEIYIFFHLIFFTFSFLLSSIHHCAYSFHTLIQSASFISIPCLRDSEAHAVAAHAATAPPAQARPPVPSGGRCGRPDPWGPRGSTQPTREIKAPGMPGLHERAAVEGGKPQRATGALVVAAGSGPCG
jgi:hypothetical protein